ncbi:MAG: hypothetical protein BRD33_02035, partial [Bacteroidetes bacterium QH_6_63_17]
IDTTTSQFDSLFTVAESDQSLSIEEEVSSLDIGSLDEALDEATEGVGANTSIAETVIEGSDLATQDVTAGYTQENGVPDPTRPAEKGGIPVRNTARSFPPALLEIPDYQIANIDAERIKSGTLTGEERLDDGATVNDITFTLSNEGSVDSTLTDRNGNAPSITIESRNGEPIGTAQFNAPIAPGDVAEATADVEGELLGEDSDLVLNVLGSDTDPGDSLTVGLSPLRYQEATVAEINEVEVTADTSGISTRGGESSSEFEGIETQEGTLNLTLTNNLQFPVDIDSLLLENNQDAALPDTFEVLGVSESAQSISPDESRTFEVNLEGRGIASVVDVAVRGGLANSHMADTLTAAAENNIDVSVGGDLTIGAMFFWPDGEEVQASGTFDFEQDRISFDRPGDFVELDAGTLAFDNLVSEPTVEFNSFVLSFPDIRGDDYGPEDSLTVAFSVPAETDPEIEDESLSYGPEPDAREPARHPVCGRGAHGRVGRKSRCPGPGHGRQSVLGGRHGGCERGRGPGPCRHHGGYAGAL